MRLISTGAFVRAARAARLAPFQRSPSIAPCPAQTAISTASRWQSTQGQAQSQASDSFNTSQPFPEQSVLINADVDPSKTAHANKDVAEGERRSFARHIKETGKEGKITGRGTQHGTLIYGTPHVFDETTNLSPSILSIVSRNLYNNPNHPICITRKLIESVFPPSDRFKNHTATNPAVTTHSNFDILGFPPDHPGRSRTDTYYINSTHVLRTHTSAHQHTAFLDLAATTQHESGYTICADVYRRDAIDRSHFPAFHQMEGAYMWQLDPASKNRYYAMKLRIQAMERSIRDAQKRRNTLVARLGTELQVEDIAHFDQKTNPTQINHDNTEVELAVRHLKLSLETLVAKVFLEAHKSNITPVSSSEPIKMRWIEAYFPFTSPSFELEVLWQGEWLELLGCGITQQALLDKSNLRDRTGWAWGIGIERLAMLLFGIPDIRLFWSEDQRFLSQFSAGKITKFEPFSKHPACYKDIAFWIDPSPSNAAPMHTSNAVDSSIAAAAGGDSTKASPTETQPAAFHENDIMEIVRDVAGTLVEDVKLTDEFVHPRTGRKSLCYRINYRSLERTLTNEEVNRLHERVAEKMVGDLGVELSVDEMFSMTPKVRDYFEI